ncbi:MAG: hypothetical protein U5L04_01265 [Trueperaceae bacterium]|nr:hypothetical protein [Trueperaceae bacterium]
MSLQEVQLDTFDQPTSNSVALQVETNSAFAGVGEVEHNLVGESEPRATYQPGDRVELRPVGDPAFDHVFVGWEGNLSGDATPETLTMTEAPVAGAVFAPRNYDAWTFNTINPFVTDPSFPARADPGANPATEIPLAIPLDTPSAAFRKSAIPPASRPALMKQELRFAPRFVYRRQMASDPFTECWSRTTWSTGTTTVTAAAKPTPKSLPIRPSTVTARKPVDGWPTEAFLPTAPSSSD